MWINLKSNYPLTKKSKNSRMGKGKGMFLRWVVTIRPSIPFAEFLGFSFRFLFQLKKSLSCCYRSDVSYIYNLVSYPIWSNTKKPRLFTIDKRKNFF